MIDYSTPPWFEDFEVGDDFSEVPAVTVTSGMTAMHQALFGDRSRLFLDQPLAQAVTGQSNLPVNPALICNLAIGQSTIPSQRVLGNLFYRGLRLRTPVFVGDTLSTQTRVVALRQNSVKPGRPASGMVGLEITVNNQRGDRVLHFWRCPMVPCRDPEARTERNDSFDLMPDKIPDEDLHRDLPAWELAPVAQQVARRDYQPGQRLLVEARDTVTSAPELVRFTLNLAMTHTDVSRSVYDKRLVYGGHTIAVAAAQMSRVMPDLITPLAWYRCDHLAPVFEEDILQSEVTLVSLQALPQGRLARLGIIVSAWRDDAAERVPVLDWELAAWLL